MEYMKHLSLELLERYVTKDLSSCEQLRVERHVKRCPECLDRLQGQVGWVSGVRSMDRMRRMFIHPPRKSLSEE